MAFPLESFQKPWNSSLFENKCRSESLGIEKEMCPFVHYQWKTEDPHAFANKGFSSFKKGDKEMLFKKQHMWIPNPDWHLLNAGVLLVVGGKSHDPDSVVHQIRHQDHPGPYHYISNPDHKIYQDKEDAFTPPGSSAITLLEEQDCTMWFRHPSNTVTNKYNQLLMKLSRFGRVSRT